MLFRLSVGCIGLLRKLLDNAIVAMRCRNGQFLTLKDIIDAAPHQAKLDAVRKDLEGIRSYIKTSATQEVVGDALARERGSKQVDVDPPLKKPARGRPGRRKCGPRDTVGNIS